MSKRTRQTFLLKDVVLMPGDPEYNRLNIEKSKAKAKTRSVKAAAITQAKSIRNIVVAKKVQTKDDSVKEKASSSHILAPM